MARELKSIMFEKGESYRCSISINYGKDGTFIKGNTYTSPENNCLTDENGNDFFVPQHLINNFE